MQCMNTKSSNLQAPFATLHYSLQYPLTINLTKPGYTIPHAKLLTALDTTTQGFTTTDTPPRSLQTTS